MAAGRTGAREVAHRSQRGSISAAGPADGTHAGSPVSDAVQHLTAEFDDWTQRGVRADCLSPDELAIIEKARDLIPAFVGEQPVPCHRYYCPANWFVNNTAAWTGVIDFEFSYRDARVSDFTRTPNWEWIERPDLSEALLDGYGQVHAPPDARQLLAGHALYALGAVVSGKRERLSCFRTEGRKTLRHVGILLR